MIVRTVCFGVAVFAGILQLNAADLIPPGAQWRYQKGLAEASTPSGAWRAVGFNDAAWGLSAMPYSYGESLGGTTLEDMRYSYTSVFLRRTFEVANPGAARQLELRTRSDDGCIVWINGTEVFRYNMPEGEVAASASSLPALSEPIPWLSTVLTNGHELLNTGQNVLAIHAFNSSLGDSSDFLMDAQLTSIIDNASPTIENIIPAEALRVQTLNTIEVIFSEAVGGVDAGDLLINGQPATEMEPFSPHQFVFTFPEPAPGPVVITWAANHGITDLSLNPFAAGSWNYHLDPNAPPPQVMISEFVADNNDSLNDEDGDDSDWIEIFNPTAAVVDMTGWFLSNNTDNYALWKFPSVSLGANSYLIVFASSKNKTNPAGKLHTSFNLRKEGGSLALSDPQTNVISAFINYPAQREDVSYGRERSNPDLVGFFTKTTPGAPNVGGGPGFAPEVKFSMPSRTFQNTFDLVLTTPHPGAVIRYVVGKTNLPDSTSPIYTGPIPITNSMQIRARAFVDGLLPGDPKSEQYIMLSSSVTSFKSDLPVVILHNNGGGSVPATGEQFVMLQLFEPRGGVTSMTNAPDMTERARFRRRGSSTLGNAKGSYAVEVWNEFGDDKKVSILGMPEESDWVFYAPNSFEPSMLHNPLMHQLSRNIGRYSSRTRFVEVYVNASSTGGAIQQTHYAGIYVIEEKVKRGADRVDVDNLQPEHLVAPEVTGGYLLKIDRADSPSDPNFSAGGQGSLVYVDPKGEEIRTVARDPQEKYINGYLNQFGTALNGANFKDPNIGYAAYFDVPAGIDHHLLNVFAYNVDALRLSTHFHKPRNGKITFGPLWDFDRALGSTDGRDANPRSWYNSSGTDFFGYGWWRRLFQDIDFWQKWIDRWEELRKGELSTASVNALIDELSGQVRNAQPREYAKWRAPLRGGTYASEIAYLKNYILQRSQWIDSQLVRPPAVSHSPGPVSAGTTVTLQATNTIFYTLDGTDPRLPQGELSTAALTYTGPITVNTNVRIFARAFKPGHALGPTLTARSPWSGAVTATLVVNPPKLAVTEIMYNPPPHPSNLYANEDFEYIELLNTGNVPINLDGFAFTKGIDFRFSSDVLQPGDLIVVVKNRTVFESRYGTQVPIAGEYSGSLDNSGERIALVGPMLEPVLDFIYEDDWYPLTDGAGFALVGNNLPDTGAGRWRAGQASPGILGFPPVANPPVYISEALAHTDPPQSDFIEIHNAGSFAVPIGGWYLSDDAKEPKKFRIPDMELGANSYSVVSESQLRAAPNGFALSSTGDEVYLFAADSNGDLTGYMHGFAFGPTANGVSLGRERTSTGEEFFVPRVAPTPTAANSAIQLGPLVITELMFQPTAVGGFDNTRDEFIEIRNNSSEWVPLYDPAHPTNTWRIRGGADFDFPENVSLPPGGILLVMNLDPVLEPWALNEFRARFAVPAQIPIHGPLKGKLSNMGERISLQRPDAPDPVEPDTVPYIAMDEFNYDVGQVGSAFANAAGSGQSAHRLRDTWAQEPSSWMAGAPTPGSYQGISLDSDNDGLPTVWELAHGLNPDSAAGADGANGDPDGDGLTNLEEYQVGTHPRDAASALRFTAINNAGGANLTMNAAAGRSYSILFSTTLSDGAWFKLADIPGGSARTVEIPDSNAHAGTRFYRLVSPAQP
jgi:hypothetical protein